MNDHRYRGFFFRFFFLFFFGIYCLFVTRSEAQTDSLSHRKKIIILHVNDMHSKIDNMAKLAYLADSLRQYNPFVFLVSAGDNFTGNPVVDQIPDVGYPMIDLMNHCGFNLSAVGNHEFDMGQEMLNKRMMQAAFRFICANLDATGAVVRQPIPYHVINAGKDTDIAFLGLLQLDENGLPSTHPSKVTGIRFMNGIEKAKDYRHLAQKHDILIALSHLGVDDDQVLAMAMPEFDVIIGGHTHTLLREPIVKNGVTIVQTGANLKVVGKLTLTLSGDSLLSVGEELISFSDLKGENIILRQLIDQYNNNKEFSKVIGYAEKPLTGADELGSLMADALVHQLHADIAFQNKGGIRIQSIDEGDITLKELFQLDPFNNEVMLYSMNTEEIRSLILYGYNLMKGIDLQVAGMHYDIRLNAEGEPSGIELTDTTGRPLNENAEYLVAVNNYVSNTYKFDHRDPGTLSKMTTAEALKRFLGVSGKIDYSGVRRATVIRK